MKSRKMIAGLGASVMMLSVAAVAAPAAQAAPVTKYSSCAKLNKDYAGGIARTGKAVNMKTVGGKKVLAESSQSPKVRADLYDRNKGLDRDKDGIACER